jgi:hypothetical protein
MQNIEKYKKYVQEDKYDLNNKKHNSYHRKFSMISPKISYSKSSNSYTFATIPKMNSFYTTSNDYFTEEPTEKPTRQINYDTTMVPTNIQLEPLTKCPTVLNSTTYIPTTNLTIHNSENIIENKSYNIVIIAFSVFSFFLFLYIIYFYKY